MIIFCFFIYSEEIVVVVATAIAILDVIFIIVCVPESLPDKCRPIASSRGLTFDQVRKCQKHLYDQTYNDSPNDLDNLQNMYYVLGRSFCINAKNLER